MVMRVQERQIGVMIENEKTCLWPAACGVVLTVSVEVKAAAALAMQRAFSSRGQRP